MARQKRTPEQRKKHAATELRFYHRHKERLNREWRDRYYGDPEWREYCLQRQREYRRQRPEAYLLNHAKTRANKTGRKFTLILADIKIPKRCPVLNIPLVQGEGGTIFGSPTIDRLDNSRGYTPDNIMIISRRANSLKSDATFKEMKKLAQFYLRITD